MNHVYSPNQTPPDTSFLNTEFQLAFNTEIKVADVLNFLKESRYFEPTQVLDREWVADCFELFLEQNPSLDELAEDSLLLELQNRDLCSGTKEDVIEWAKELEEERTERAVISNDIRRYLS